MNVGTLSPQGSPAVGGTSARGDGRRDRRGIFLGMTRDYHRR
jgi:hypothetical protein